MGEVILITEKSFDNAREIVNCKVNIVGIFKCEKSVKISHALSEREIEQIIQQLKV